MRVVMSLPLLGPLRGRWVAQHFDCEPGRRFRDRQVSGPFSSWVHTHHFLPDPVGSMLVDEIDYRLPGGAVGQALGGGFVKKSLDRMFHFRHQRTRDDLGRHAPFADQARLRIAISGASGLVGGMLRPFLTTGGHEVCPLVRRSPHRSLGEIHWNPDAGTLDSPSLEGIDAAIHLSGSNIASGRWTQARKADFARSRVQSTQLLCRTLSRLKKPPKVLISASATGIYGNRGEERLTEDSPLGEGFLPDLCRQWEAATLAAQEAGIRVVHMRIGIVLSAKGGALSKLLTPYRLGLGGRIGSGQQYMSWISSDDLLGVFLQCLFDERLRGPINAVSPGALTNAQFAAMLAGVLHRPALMPLPAATISLAFGEMGRTILLEGARVVPGKLQSLGFRFAYPTLEEALRWELGLPEVHT